MFCNKCSAEIETPKNYYSPRFNSVCVSCRSSKTKMRYCTRCRMPIYPSYRRNNYQGSITLLPSAFLLCHHCKTIDFMKKRFTSFPYSDPMWSVESKGFNVKQKLKVRGYTAYHREKAQIVYECPCTTDGQKHMHHYDYSKPLSVWLLCRSCHMSLHAAIDFGKTTHENWALNKHPGHYLTHLATPAASAPSALDGSQYTPTHTAADSSGVA